jgi:serine/threonine protein phosphatase PrpC
MRYTVSARTDKGRKRRNNQDAILVESFSNESGVLIAVADGMGGIQGGGVASRTAIATLREEFFPAAGRQLDPRNEDLELALNRSYRRCRDTFRSEIDRDEGLSEMGTTLTCIVATENRIVHAHVGDSRAYRYSEGRLDALTSDHTVAHDLVSEGKIRPEDATRHPSRNVLTRWLSGTGAAITPDLGEVEARTGDLYLICSDGLYTMVDERVIADTLKTPQDLDARTERLIALANDAGGADNVSVVLLYCS